MPLVTQTELEEASTDAQTLEDVVNGAADLNGDGTVVSRLGTSLKTLAKLIEQIGAVDLGELIEPGTRNIFVGTTAGNATVTGTDNFASGHNSMRVVGGGSQNSAVGTYSLESLISATHNTGFGARALRALTSGNYNTAIGQSAINGATTAGENVAIGANSMIQVNNSNQNVVIGVSAMFSATGGSNNVIIGYLAGNGSGAHSKSGCVFIGNRAGSNENGSNKLYIANSSTATPLIGGDFSAQTLDFNANEINFKNGMRFNYNANRFLHFAGSTDNLFLGAFAGHLSVTGAGNTSIGYATLNVISTAANNTAFGESSSRAITTGSRNVSVGSLSLRYNQSGNDNTAIGYSAGAGTTGNSKTGGVFIGHNAGANENGSNKLYIANSNTATPLIGGDFAAATLSLNAAVTVSQSLALTHGAERSAASGAGVVWTASGAGTKDGVAYAAGDVLVTSNVGGTSKTVLLMDHSAA